MGHYLYQDQLESKRIRTRFLTLDDVSEWANFFDDQEATKYLPKFSFNTNQETATYWIERQLKRYEGKEFGLQALIDKQNSKVIGQCGLLTQKINGITEVEVGYHIFRQYWGQGLAPEAANLFIDYAFTNNLTTSVISIIDVNNIKSQRVAEKNGLIREKQLVWSNLDVYIYRIKHYGTILGQF